MSSDDLSSAVLGSVRQATSDLTSAVLGADAGSVVAEGLDTIVAAQARRSRLKPKMDPASHASAHHGALSPSSRRTHRRRSRLSRAPASDGSCRRVLMTSDDL